MDPQRFCLSLLVAVFSAHAQIQIEQVLGSPAMASEVLIQPRPGVSISQLAAAFDGYSIQPVGNSGWLRLRSRSIAASALVRVAAASTLVAASEPNYVVRALDTLPVDPAFSELWGLRNTGQVINGSAGLALADIGVTRAWDITIGSRDTLVGVIDTGVDYLHADLAGNIWSAARPYSITLGGITYTCPAGSHGFNAVALTCDPLDDNNHGTHLAGIIGALGNNSLGVSGVNWKASMVAIKVLNLYGTASIADAVNGIDAAVQLKTQGFNLRVLNASWSSGARSTPLEQAIANANASDILFVAAAGNSAESNDGAAPNYPSSYRIPNIVAVAATNNRDQLAPFSSFGASSVHLGAPGVDVLSTFIGGTYATLSGTSMAAPHVAGSAALILSRCALNTSALKALLLNSVDPVPALSQVTITGGRMNVDRALRQCGATPVPDFQLSASPATLTIVPGNTSSVAVRVQQFFGLTGAVNLSLAGLPAGVTVTFSPPTLIGSGTATLALTVAPNVALGSYPLLLTGTSSTVTNSLALLLNVYTPDFALAVPSTASLTSAAPITLPITLSAIAGYSAPVQLSASGLPAGITALFSPSTLTGAGSSVLALTASSSTLPGKYSFRVEGASSGLVRNTLVTLTVSPPPDFTLSASPTALTAAPGGPTSTTITVLPIAGFSGLVNLTVEGATLGSGFTAAFSPPGIQANGTSVLTLTAGPNAAMGTYPLLVRASSGTLSRTTAITLTVVVLPAVVLSLPPSLDIGATVVVGVTLPAPAPNGGLDVTLVSSNPAVAALSTVTIYIPGGQTNSSRARISGLTGGVSSITALANGYAPAMASIQVGRPNGTLSLTPSVLSLAAPGTRNLTLSVSPPAPTGGLIVTLSSNNPQVASVPESILMPANASSLAIPVAALTPGSTIVTANAPNYTSATANVTISGSPSPLAIATASLPTGQAGQTYIHSLVASGGTRPYAWSLTGGTLPAGLTLDPASGLLSGVPIAAVANRPLAFRVTDASAAPQTASATFPLTIDPANSASADSIILPTSFTLVLGTDSSMLVRLPVPAPAGGVEVTLTSSHPAVASLNIATIYIPAGQSSSLRARISGLGSGTALVTAMSQGFAPATVPVQVVGPASKLSFTPVALSLVAAGTGSLTLSLSPPAPPTGLIVTLSSTNALAASVPVTIAVPAHGSAVSVPVSALAPGSTTIAATAPSYGNATANVTVTGGSSPLSIATVSLAAGQAGQAYSQALSASGGTRPYTWTLTNGPLPAGLSLDPTTGLISGRPLAAVASLPLAFRVTDSSLPRQSASATLLLIILPALPASGESIVLPDGVTLVSGADTSFLVRLSMPAPPGGLDVTLTTSNPAVAALSLTTIYIPAGQTSSLRARVAGLSPGIAVVTALANGYAPASTPVQVGSLGGG